jgi:hypothetical protein
MGMDVIGRKPTSKRGEYFRNSIHSWHPLADYCISVAPDICAACKHWHGNEGDGLDAVGATALADALQAELDNGRTAAYAAAHANDPPHPIAQGIVNMMTSMISTVEGVAPADVAPIGKKPLVENVTNFVGFLRDSGGFSID